MNIIKKSMIMKILFPSNQKHVEQLCHCHVNYISLFSPRTQCVQMLSCIAYRDTKFIGEKLSPVARFTDVYFLSHRDIERNHPRIT